MALFKKNIWLIFYILMLFSTVLFCVIAYIKWDSVYLRYQNAQENIVEILANTTQSLFDTQERLMDILGTSITTEKHNFNNPEKISKYALPLLKNPAVTAFGVTRPDGNFVYGSTNEDPSKIINLLKYPASRLSFIEALQSHSMVFGRTYFSPETKSWVMPIRKTIRDSNDQPIVVLTVLLSPTLIFDNLIANIHHKKNLLIAIIRDSDLYPQYLSNDINTLEKAYLTPFTEKDRNNIYETIFHHYGLSSDELKRNEILVSFPHKHADGTHYLASLKFNNNYKIWTIVHTHMNTIIYDFLWVIFTYFLIYLTTGIGFFFLFRLIARADEKRKNDLIFQATHDSLTSLPNRSYLQQAISYWSYKNAPPFSLIYVDMDHFKNINDSFGHQFGDHVLVEISKRLKSICPQDSLIVRYGGDEFVILMNLCEHQALLIFSFQLIELLSKPYNINELNFNISASVGIALYPNHGESLDMLLRSADIALSKSKMIKNSVHIFADTMQDGFLNNIKMEQALRKAITNNELSMVYQPQVNSEGILYGVEALVRWHNPSLGHIPPSHFIPLAETFGLMPHIGRFILETACTQMHELHTTLKHTFHVSINISVRQLMDTDFYTHLINTIERTHIDTLALTLEVTENLFIEDINLILPLLEKIRALGIQISMDDFGTGYSSLSMLKKLPIDEVKIDKSFVDDIVEDLTSQKMVQNIIAIGQNFEMQIIAEGVESIEQKELLHAFGCNKFQGYYFAKPLSKESLLTFIQSQKTSL
ncbi:MAG: EAL domain-containing protein [Sulfurospirillaceae bacterium]|nr:EAL domain-containing protein [Sulfurospirillaceae bacterium]